MNSQYINKFHVIMEIVGYILHIMAVAYAVVCACTIDENIPIHYDLYGTPDSYGSAFNMLLEPAVLLGVSIMISLITHFMPRKYLNTGFKLNPGHEVIVYTDINYMLISMVPIFGLFSLVNTMNFTKPYVTQIVIIPEMVLIFGSIIFFFIKAFKDNRD